jgi:3-hydroxyisobutyrate dehydrogenase-like beta-hydroxyacid dehydrogenase
VNGVADLASQSEIVMICVGLDREVEAVYPTVLRNMTAGSVLVIHSTVHADLARRMAAEATERDVAVLDVPVCNGRPGALAGTLLMLVGGDKAVFERVRPLLEWFGTPHHMGPVGAGVTMKVFNNYLNDVQTEILRQAADALHDLGMNVRQSLEALSEASSSTQKMRSIVANWVEHEDGTVNLCGGLKHAGGPLRSATMSGEVLEHARDLMTRANALQPDLDRLAQAGFDLNMAEAVAAEASSR